MRNQDADDSPAPFIVFRTQTPAKEPYQTALMLVGLVHRIVDSAATRFYLRDRLDRAATGLVFELGRAAAQVQPLKWKSYRAAQVQAADVATVLDIFVAQQATSEDDLLRARALVRELLEVIAPRCNG